MSFLTPAPQIKSSLKLPTSKILLKMIAAGILLTPIYALANDHFSSWSDKTVCRLAKATPDDVEYQAEVVLRKLSCGSAVNSTESEPVQLVSITSAVQQSTTTGNWFTDEIMYSPHFVKSSQQFRKKAWTSTHWQFADFDNDGVQDFFMITNPMQTGFDWSHDSPECNTSIGTCWSEEGSFSLVKVTQSGYRFSGVEVTDDFFIDNNPIEMRGTDGTDLHVADFNGDGVLDVFQTENVSINKDKSGKNDMYFLSQPDGTWLESTSTHVTGTWDCSYCKWTKGHGVKKGKGLINFSHGSSIGDIDGDGDIDIVVTSPVWHGWTKSRSKKTENGYIYCYENQGDGHMVVRQCGDQWGQTAELGDIDNDGDLDLVWGSRQMSWVKEWNIVEQSKMTGCTSKNHCNGAWSGILLNDGTGNFYKRGFEFNDVFTKTTGFAYQSTPAIGLIDLDGDGDLDVVRSFVGNLYSGAGMTIEENIGKGKFRTVLYDEFCVGNTDKNDWMKNEGGPHNCWVNDFKFGDFNKDGLVDIYLDGHDADKSTVISDGAIYMSTGKYTYDIVLPNNADYPLKRIKLRTTRK